MTSIVFRNNSFYGTKNGPEARSIIEGNVPGLFDQPRIKIAQGLLTRKISESFAANCRFVDHADLSQISRLRKNYPKIVQ
jgi:hypothetical protein